MQGRKTITVADAGEFGLIRRVTARALPGEFTLLGPGDDAAVLRAADGRVVVTTDLLVEGRHFRRDWSTAYDVGRKAAAQNLADVAAMGAVPTGIVVGLACPPDLPLDWADGLADGLRDECGLVRVGVVGGDVSRSEVLTIAVTALGDLEGRPAVTRSGARPSDQVAVAGKLGWAAAGLAVLARGFRSPAAVVNAYRRPEPPYAAGPQAATLGATAMIDVSDGLVADLGHVARLSAVRVELGSGAFEVPARLREVGSALGLDPLDWVLSGGEDHALAATFPAGVALPEGWLVAGRVVEGAGVLVDGEEYAGPPGWDHFG
ncbi:MAG TPA: thiamine-phosphate kinase [Mycobacteriales bacterium]|nr:thiamine-phosphate kinase [Mycobacteriales bacterium]